MAQTESMGSPFQFFTRQEWSSLRDGTPMSLSEQDLAQLRGLNDELSLEEVAETYLPLSRFFSLHVRAIRGLENAKNDFLKRDATESPFVIAVAGSVAVGKSTFARVLQALLSQWPDRPEVGLVTTDGFLYPNATLQEKGLMRRKGFPESYDMHHLLSFLNEVKAGTSDIAAPVYSHLTYDIVPGRQQTIKRPDILIFEGLNVLQTPSRRSAVASDFFDFSIYLDADGHDIERWFIERFLILQRTAFQDPSSHFFRYRNLAKDEAEEMAATLWREINLPNLKENIEPTLQRSDLILSKDSTHRIQSIQLRR
jgi:type I pantothenate kinase